MKLVTAATMREMDRRTIEEFKIPGIVLMENAALRVVEAIVERYSPLEGKGVAVLCGKGNNGGDGFAIARHLALRYGATVDVFSLQGEHPVDTQTPAPASDSVQNMLMVSSIGMSVYVVKNENASTFQSAIGIPDIVVDALFGTGFRGSIEGIPAHMIEVVNALRTIDSVLPGLGVRGPKPSGSRVVVVAVDIPSGVNADTGDIDGPAIEADLTVTFGLAKPGLICFPGAKNAGELVIGDICMPRQVINDAPEVAHVTEPADVAQWLPRRENGRDSNKGKFGHVLVLTGSRGFLGAANMASHSAARTGAGLVTLAVPESLLPAAMSAVDPVIMTRGLSETNEGTFSKQALEAALEQAKKSTVVAMGPGIGAHVSETAEFVREFIKQCPVPMVIDADALNILASEPDHGVSILTARQAATVLTPHPGEMARLIGKSTKDVQADRFGIVREAAERYRCTVLLKGARTLIATAGQVALNINVSGNAGMATGGAGDVLTGIIAALLGMGLDPHAAASAGAYIHGLSGDITAERHGGKAGLIATDLIDHLPEALGRLNG
jgi:NAD(P)H-hydrate epimerase